VRSRSIEIVSADGTVLSGTLSLPRWSRHRVPALVIVHGSGPLTRDATRGDVRRLVWEGIGVLAYDKRGVGASQGVYPRNRGNNAESVLRTLAADAAAALDRLRQEPDVDRPAGSEPADRLRASRVPTMWLLGERDESVPTFATVRVLDSIRASGNLSHTAIAG
jgi:pimeloyl-ACP methyl ester carboxylesterase